MHYENAYSKQSLNQKVSDYEAKGYKVKDRTHNYVKLVKNDVNWWIFIILLIFIWIIAIIYLIYKLLNKDEIIIRLKEDVSNIVNTNNTNTIDSDEIDYCKKCRVIINSKNSKFCQSCGIKINEESDTVGEIKIRQKDDLNNGIFEHDNSKESSTIKSAKFQKYEDSINDLKEKYQNKENIARKLIKEYFPPPQITYDKFMGEIDSWNRIFVKQSDIALNIIGIDPEFTEKVDKELSKRVDMLKSFVEKMEELTIALTINLDNSSEKTEDEEVRQIFEDIQKTIDSVKEYV